MTRDRRHVDALVGERLRVVRRQRGLSLSEVQAASGGEFRISALGAYERGERGVQVHRLLRLAEIYGVRPGALLPQERLGPTGSEQPGSGEAVRPETSPGFPPEAVL
ncbi:helix-turn-helix domain-containing protein [Candidatus Poriferisodalis sp.]|uniref:helix-turn-helix domain-containing protein n=1 Tax=Candidatus Poriferisodalis sp. TaxID=3101277 RepID=UPI003B5A0129